MKYGNGNKITNSIMELFDLVAIDEYFERFNFKTSYKGKAVAECLSTYLRAGKAQSKYDTLKVSVAC